MAKIEIDKEELKEVLTDALTDIIREDSRATNQTSLELKDIEISTLRRQVATYKTMISAYKEKIAEKDRAFRASLSRNRAISACGRACEEENEKLAREVDRLNDDIKTYKEVVCDLTKACNKVKGDIDQEFEEAVRGDLMNLKLVKKYLDKVRPTAKTKDEYLKAMNIVDKDISNLDKFVEERWGHGEED